jgi:hypothetical protein
MLGARRACRALVSRWHVAVVAENNIVSVGGDRLCPHLADRLPDLNPVIREHHYEPAHRVVLGGCFGHLSHGTTSICGHSTAST